MKAKNMYVSLAILVLLLLLSLVPGSAQAPDDRPEPQGALGVEAEVSAKISYQGMLRENGAPVTGTRDMLFQLFSNAACTTQVGSDISIPGVEVSSGYFDVELPIAQTFIDGNGRWLGIEIEGTATGCQELLPVPYAYSLIPGSSIIGEETNWDAIHAVNTASTGLSYGLYGRSLSTEGRGVSGYAQVNSGTAYGVFGRSDSTAGAGLYARGVDSGADLILGGNADTTTGDDGVIRSDPNYASSDIILAANDGIRIDLDRDGDGEDADVEIRNKDNTVLFDVDESGAVIFGGAGIAAFPRPAYNSGWVTLNLGATTTRTHNLGGNVDNYVVDFTCRVSGGGAGVNNWGVGGDANNTEYYGAWWSNLTTTTIILHRWTNDTDCPQVRVRIWMYP